MTSVRCIPHLESSGIWTLICKICSLPVSIADNSFPPAGSEGPQVRTTAKKSFLQMQRRQGALDVWAFGEEASNMNVKWPEDPMMSIYIVSFASRLMGQMRSWDSEISPMFQMAMEAEPTLEPCVHTSCYHSHIILLPWVGVQSFL